MPRKSAKERHIDKLLNYLGDPSNEFLDRQDMATQVLGFSHGQTLYKVFSVDEIQQIERDALDIRRKKYASHLAKIDISMLKEAANGNVKAADLVYKRFEGWAEKRDVSVSFDDEVQEIMSWLKNLKR